MERPHCSRGTTLAGLLPPLFLLLSPPSTGAAATATRGEAERIVEARIAVNFAARPQRRFNTTPTLQVVTNPLLDRHFVLDNGTAIPNPIHSAAWTSLGNLGTDHVRFQPWFPYPHMAVPELDLPRPGKRETSWNFTSFLPQLEDFMSQTAAKGYPVVWNFGTVPCWMFGLANCNYPKDPSKSDFDYGDKGVRALLKDPTAKTLAKYYGRVMSYLVRGEMTDEFGLVHRGGPAFNFSRKAGHIFEFLNEGEHRYTPADHVHDYDVVVDEIIQSLGGRLEDSPYFMGIGGCQNGNWAWWFMGNCSKWLPAFLDRSKHHDQTIPLDYASIHYYASAANRSDVSSFTRGFFSSADQWLEAMEANLAVRARLAPETRIAMTELGTLMVDDMSKTFGRDGGLPDLYFNAAGAFYAYVFGHMSMKDVAFLCFSQLIGSPPIPEWNIKDMQFPSASMLSWETGFGNAKYWVLKLLIDHLRQGDLIYEAAVQPTAQTVLPRQVVCESVGHWNFLGSVTLTCADEGSVIEEIWADAGMAPSGSCGTYEPSKVCSSHRLTTAWAEHKCKGKQSCTLASDDRVVDGVSCPLKVLGRKVDPHDVMLTVQARCSGGGGGRSSADYSGAAVFAVGFGPPEAEAAGIHGAPRVKAGVGGRRILLVNKEAHAANVTLDLAGIHGDLTAHIVDPLSVQRSAEHGIRNERWQRGSSSSSLRVTLQPYAVVVAEEDDVADARIREAFV